MILTAVIYRADIASIFWKSAAAPQQKSIGISKKTCALFAFDCEPLEVSSLQQIKRRPGKVAWHDLEAVFSTSFKAEPVLGDQGD